MKATVYKVDRSPEDLEIVFFSTDRITLSDDVESRLTQLQKIVGGWIDIYNHNGDDIVINDEGLIIGEPLNFWAASQGLQLYGTIVKIDGKLE